ncbi:Flagellar biosynthesis protein FlhF [hydrothermal vent metagenome]|uniref:Flagellar biosynthesis protein FlhF n=1 Tax=hydrothermal vent metagenome TaxID=652676 RepID=A0A1W1C514_9ZZZZ
MIDVKLVSSTPQSAYALAKERYGDSFKLISAKQIHDPVGNKVECEITISVPKDKFLQLPEQQKENQELQNELEILKRELESLKSTTQESRVLSIFEQKGISREWLNEITAPLIGSTLYQDDKLLVSYILQEIDESLEIKREDFKEQKIMMFVGPTGVGKTTTVAKLAARYAYMLEERLKVALVNLDSFKVGAIEQLSHFSDIMKLEHFKVNGVAELKEVLARVKGYDVVLIDTAGMSPFDTEKLIKTVEYLNSNSDIKIEVNLVISATVKFEDAVDIYQTFSFLNIDSLILSKIDETKHLGDILSFILLHSIPLSYFSIGQEVPDDLMVADREYILQNFIGDLDG